MTHTVRQYLGSRRTTWIEIYPVVKRDAVDVTLHMNFGTVPSHSLPVTCCDVVWDRILSKQVCGAVAHFFKLKYS